MKKKITIITLLLTLLMISCTDHKELMHESFDNYKAAILNNDEKEALKYVHSNTAGYFSYIIREIKYADSSEVNSYPPKDKFTILLIRHLCTKDEILKFNRNTLMAFIIDKWSIGKKDIESLTLGKINIDKDADEDIDIATGRILSYNLKTHYYLDFYNEENLWKIDISPSYASITRGLRKMINDSGMEENECILQAIKEFSGKDPKNEIWNNVLNVRKVRIIKKPT